MATTPMIYAQVAATGDGGYWTLPGLAAGAPDGNYAAYADSRRASRTQLNLAGYDPQATVLAATGGRAPYAIERLQVTIDYSIDDAASNYDSISILLLKAGAPIAAAPLYLLNAGSRLSTREQVTFAGHAGYGGGSFTWNDLNGLTVAVQVVRSGAAGPDTFRVDAVGMTVAYTADKPRYSATAATAPATSVSLRAYTRAGERLGVLPWTTLSRGIVRNAPGALASAVPRSQLTDALLGEEVYLRVAENGIEAPDWYLLQEDGDDDADEGGAARPVSIGGVGIRECLSWALVYPRDHQPGGALLGSPMKHEFGQVTPGRIMLTLIEKAQARGVIPHITVSFTADVDSAGRAWPTLYSRVYDVGGTVGKVLDQMAEDAWVDYEFVGFRLDLYAPDDGLAVDFPDSVLRLGQGVTQAPRKRTRASTRSTVLAAGAEGATVEVSDPDATARLGRRESFDGRGGISDVGTLSAATLVSLARQTSASESVTLAVEPSTAPPIPRPGGFLRYDQRRLSPTELEPLRVQSIAWEYGEDPKLSVELADLWVDRDVRLERRVDAILNGSSANERVPPEPIGDEMPPADVQGLSLVSAPYTDPSTGQGYAQVSATWLEVTADADGSIVDELLGYAIEWQQPTISDATYSFETGVVTLHSWSPVVPGVPLRARIRAFDRWRNFSPQWSPWVQITTGLDETPPPKPTTPQVDNYLGLLRSYWDGGFVGGSARPADFDILEVHVSDVDGFAPSTATLVATMYAPGAAFTDTPYQVAQFVKFVAVDVAGNRSTPSDQGTGATGAVVSADIFDGAVGTAKLADLAVKSAKIDLLAVNSAQVGTIEVGKLIAGTMTAEVIMGGRIATALTGQRVEINSLGIFRWDAAGNQTVAIDDNGALITGRYRTAITGRRVEIGAAGSTGELVFVSPNGSTQYLRSIAWATGVEALQLRAGAEALVQATSDNGVGMWGWRAGVYFRDYFEVRSADSVLVNNQRVRHNIQANGDANWYPGTNAGSMELRAAGDRNSPWLALHANYQDRGVAWRVQVRTTDNIQLMQCVYPSSDTFAYAQAAAWDNMSDVAHKENVRTLQSRETGDLVEVLLAAPVHHYRYKDVPGGRDHIGLLAHQAPEQIVSGPKGDQSIDTYGLTVAVLLAVQQLNTRLKRIEDARA